MAGITGPQLICSTTKSFIEIKTDQIETSWTNMYGVRPLPRTAINIYQGTDESAEQSAYRGRILCYATAERPKPEEPQRVMVLPKIYSKAEQDSLIPREEDYILRCDLYDGSDIPGNPASRQDLNARSQVFFSVV